MPNKMFFKITTFTFAIALGYLTIWKQIPAPDMPKLEPSLQPEKIADLEMPKDKIHPDENKIIQQIKLLFDQGNYSACLAQIEISLQGNLQIAQWLSAQRSIVLTAMGWEQLKAGHCDTAEDFFAKARAKNQSKIALAILGNAFCLQKNFKLEEASKEYLLYLESNSEDSKAWENLAKVYEDLGLFSEADVALEKALATAETNKHRLDIEKEQKALKKQGASAANKQYISSANFRLYYDEEQHMELANPIFNHLEESLQRFVNLLNFSSPERQIDVFLYPKDEFKAIYSNVPHWVGGLYDGKIRVPLISLQKTDLTKLHQLLNHELLHALLHSSTQSHLPTWFDEGMAEFFSCNESPCKNFSFGPTPGTFLSENELSGSFLNFDAAKALKAYRQSLFLVLTLEKQFQLSGLSDIISNLKNVNDLNSDKLLAPLGINFNTLWNMAKTKWEKRQF